MHFRIYALENTNAELCAGSSTTSDTMIADLIRDKYLSRGLIAVVEREEENGKITSRRFSPTIADAPKTINQIAKEHLSIDNIETRNNDSFDFYTLSVWQIKAALEEAVRVGKEI